MDTITPDKDGIITLGQGQFGWEVEDYYDAFTKACYVSLYVRDWVMERGVPNLSKKKEFERILSQVIMSQTGCLQVVIPEDTKFDNYIDHQSVENGDLDHLFEDPESLRQFIFNPSSCLHTDNDNY